VPYRLGEGDDLGWPFESNVIGGFEKGLAAGGDGTVSRVAQAMIRHDIDMPLGIYPVGTANDFALNFGVPGDVGMATDIILNGRPAWSDVGLVNGIPFVNVASLGLLAELSLRTDTRAKNNLGMLAYWLKALEELPAMTPFKVGVEGRGDGVGFQYSGEALLILVMNGVSAGGFKRVAPNARVDDGVLDVIVFQSCPPFDILPLLFQVGAGGHLDNPHVRYFRASEMKVTCDRALASDIDGEAGPATPLDIRVLSRRLRVCAAPAAGAARAGLVAPAFKAAAMGTLALGMGAPAEARP